MTKEGGEVKLEFMYYFLCVSVQSVYLIEEHLENTSKYFLFFQITFRVFLNRTRIAVGNKIKVLEKPKNLKPSLIDKGQPIYYLGNTSISYNTALSLYNSTRIL